MVDNYGTCHGFKMIHIAVSDQELAYISSKSNSIMHVWMCVQVTTNKSTQKIKIGFKIYLNCYLHDHDVESLWWISLFCT